MITSRGNSKIKNVRKLQKSSKHRKEEKVFLVEGLKMVLEAPKGQIKECYISESFFGKNALKLKTLECPYEVVSEELFLFISDTKTPQGILAIIEQKCCSLEEILEEEILKEGSSMLLILEGIRDPGNLGTIFRTAEAAGVTGILMSKDCADIYNPKTIRGTMGAIYRMPHVVFTNIEETLEKIKKAGIRLFATNLRAEKDFHQADYKGATAFIIGNEGSGLSDLAVSLSHEAVKIPMKENSESLNVAIATSLLVFEVFRQRGF